jgi:hypothetical protein
MVLHQFLVTDPFVNLGCGSMNPPGGQQDLEALLCALINVAIAR